jgi:hypothetical protein
MDIRMPGMDGLEASRHLAQMDEPPAIIFTTAYSEHALEAFNTHAVSYLVKPIRQERLARALAKARKLTQAQLATLAMESDPQCRSHICARIRGNLELISVDDVIFFQADQKYITVRHRNGEILIEDALKNPETEFSKRFIRIHPMRSPTSPIYAVWKKPRCAFSDGIQGHQRPLGDQPPTRGGGQKVSEIELRHSRFNPQQRAGRSILM